MNLEEIISQRIQNVLTPPDPLPVFVAEIRYPHHAWYELDNPREMKPEELAPDGPFHIGTTGPDHAGTGKGASGSGFPLRFTAGHVIPAG